MISKLKQLLLAVSVPGLVMLGSVANAGQVVQGNRSVAPPPPGPYNATPGGMTFRPDPDLERAGNHMPPPYPADFSNANERGSLTRQQFNAQQEAHRKQMEQYYKQREAEMNKRVKEMQKRMDAMEKEDEARLNRSFGNVQVPAAPKMQTPEDVQKRWAREDAEQQRLWEQQKAEQEKRWKQQKAEQEKQMQQIQADQDHWANSRSHYRPQGDTPARQARTQAAPSAPQSGTRTTAPPAPAAPPAYGYPPRGYGYPPPPPYGYYGAPRRPYYPPYPAPAAGGYQGAR